MNEELSGNVTVDKNTDLIWFLILYKKYTQELTVLGYYVFLTMWCLFAVLMIAVFIIWLKETHKKNERKKVMRKQKARYSATVTKI